MFSGYIDSKGDLYEITLSTSVDGFRVRVRLERQSWANSFSPQYISELTKKTGCHKDFDTFITLLAKAITGKENTECCLQILTPADLESLRNGSTSARQPSHIRPPGDRRYLLLTVHNNYEKNHFPLSLLPESSQVFNPTSVLKPGNTLHFPNKSESDALELRTIIGQLQDEIRRLKAPDTVAHQKSNFEALVYENMMLKQKLEEAKNEVKTVTSAKHQRQIRKLVRLFKCLYRLSRKSTVTRSSTPDPSHHSLQNDTLDSYTGSQASLRLEDSLINGSSFNIGEIDQRLEALQMYINEALH
ncbi:Oidioi.mRNA.OKI2018_I69.PAR.g10643.t1.cds [Oikopleura dioica]|uniref:Oidioi.mRNA.OKI2018_I69.PAR.g10643.t1.cds n=1 Tax=Oikopleura dioica TaxID=34765 RepID=A0ABN7RZ27_OIKDI|nr:Oidioi.mRNA.OKI2018_I69.PAR.g10643.t1.cds [Oikopleura dioica]